MHKGLSIVALTMLMGEISCFQMPSIRTMSSHVNENQRHKEVYGSTIGFHQSVSFLKSSTVLTEASSNNNSSSKDKLGKVVFLLPNDADKVMSKYGSLSPYGSANILEVANHLVKKVQWFSDDTVAAEVILATDDVINSSSGSVTLQTLQESDALIAFHLTGKDDVQFLKSLFDHRKSNKSSEKQTCQFALACSESLAPVVGPFDLSSPSLSSTLLPWTNDASGKRMEEQMMGLFDRWNSDDATIALMLFFNQFSDGEIDWVKHSIDATWEKGPVKNAQEFYSMITNCGDCIAKCLADEKCKECLDELTAVDTRDQVASYRTIVSYESELLKDFSFCILQKNNIFNCSAKVPSMPKVEPMKTWRGKELTHEIARSLLIGHLDEEGAPEGSTKIDVSWKVAAGANVAYDQFPSQNQIFYEGVNGRDMWYDPVFRVETNDGRHVWCKRHYRVRNGPVPGTFKFSVLDNGVTSNEFWTLVATADDLSWMIFQYAGAAGAVGQRYLGGLLCTADGSLPEGDVKEEIWGHLRSAGIQPWELFIVDNQLDSPGALAAGEAPLDYFRKDVKMKKEEKRLQSAV